MHFKMENLYLYLENMNQNEAQTISSYLILVKTIVDLAGHLSALCQNHPDSQKWRYKWR